jgi:integrase/recombinase XerD
MSEVISNNEWKDNGPLEKWLTRYKKKPQQLQKHLSSFKAYQEFKKGKSPEQIFKRAKKLTPTGRGDELFNFFEWLKNDYVRKKSNREVKTKRGVVKKGMAPSTAQNYVSSIRKFFRTNELHVEEIEAISAKPRIENKSRRLYVEDIRKLLHFARKTRDKAIILTLFQSGIDITTLQSLIYDKVKAGIEGSERPLVLHLQRSKTDVIFHTCLGSDALNALKLYIEERRRSGEVIDDDSLLFPITKKAIEGMMRKTALRAGLVTKKELEDADISPVRPYSLRKAFSNILKNKTQLNNDLIEHLMGHAIDYNSAYHDPDPREVKEHYKSIEKLLSPSEGLIVEDEDVSALRGEIANLETSLREREKSLLRIIYSMQIRYEGKPIIRTSDKELESEILDDIAKQTEQIERVKSLHIKTTR